MLAGGLIASAIIFITLLTIPIPFVHLVTLIPGPFVAGYIGGTIANANEGRIITFGLFVAAIMVIPAILLLLIGLVAGVEGPLKILLLIAGISIIPYVWWAVTIGALISYLVRRRGLSRITERPN